MRKGNNIIKKIRSIAGVFFIIGICLLAFLEVKPCLVKCNGRGKYSK